MDDERLTAAIEALAHDAESGASELVARAVGILERAREQGRETLVQAARGVCAAQPSMAPMWNAAIAALADQAAPGTLARFAHRLQRSSAALRRVAVEELTPDGSQPLHLVTCSFSGSVLAVLADLAQSRQLTEACAEGRPRLEGRRLASALAPAANVEFYTDAAISLALHDSAAVVVGADAITPDWFLNKSGTFALAAAASLQGVPVFVLATRDKFLPPAIASALSIEEHDLREVWADAPEGVRVRNPYFERVPLTLVTAVITDAGALAVDMVAEACRASAIPATPEVLDALGVLM
jgi:translation initiation factor 2B subunit (eIF-2B alpha/beta/delta family)